MKDKSKNILSFASYDFSNSGYVVMFQSFLFPLVLAAAMVDSKIESNSAWAWLVAVSSLIAIIGAPFIGRFADRIGKWRVFVVTVLCAGLIAAIVSATFSSNLVILIIGFLLFNTAFELSQSLYNSFINNIEKDKKGITSLSTFAWGFGYLGGALFAGLYFGFEKNAISNHVMLFIFALLYLILSIPSMISFRRIENRESSSMIIGNWKQLLHPTNPVSWTHLIIYWIIADCVASVLYFAPLFLQQEVGLKMQTVGMLMLGAQLLAFPLTVLMGKIANKIGRIKTIQFSLIIWAISLVGLYFSKSLAHVIPVVLMLSLVIGSTQAILRAHFVSRVSTDKSGEGLGFYAIAQKSASVVSPALVALVVTITGTIRPAFIVLALLVSVGFFFAPRLNIVSK